MRMATRGLIPRIPLWIWVTGIITLVLAGIVISAALLYTSSGGDPGHGPIEGNTTSDHRPQQRRRLGRPRRWPRHWRAEQRDGHNQGQGEPAGPSEPDLAALDGRSVTIINDELSTEHALAERRWS
jgi:hypothetical protein